MRFTRFRCLLHLHNIGILCCFVRVVSLGDFTFGLLHFSICAICFHILNKQTSVWYRYIKINPILTLLPLRRRTRSLISTIRRSGFLHFNDQSIITKTEGSFLSLLHNPCSSSFFSKVYKSTVIHFHHLHIHNSSLILSLNILSNSYLEELQ